MATIHLILQGKGGVGKSMIASVIYQVLRALGYEVQAYDTDPVNATLASYKEFNVERIKLLDDAGNINARNFDELLEKLANTSPDSHVVVDNGASSFIALGAYMTENDMLEALAEYGHKVFFHTVITGGQSILDTIDGFVELPRCFPNSKIVVWINPFFGAVEMDGKPYNEFKCFKQYESNIHSIIELPLGNKDLIGKDLENLFAKRQSFEVGINSSNHIAVRSRLKKYWNTMLSTWSKQIFLKGANMEVEVIDDLQEHYAVSQEESKVFLEDGIGMSLEEVKSLIAKHNETIIDKDDPVLLIVTILNAFMSENKRLQDKYMEALKLLYSDQVKDFVSKVNKNTDEVKETLKTVSVAGLIKINNEQTKKVTELQSQLRNTCIIIGVLVLVDIVTRFWS